MSSFSSYSFGFLEKVKSPPPFFLNPLFTVLHRVVFCRDLQRIWVFLCQLSPLLSMRRREGLWLLLCCCRFVLFRTRFCFCVFLFISLLSCVFSFYFVMLYQIRYCYGLRLETHFEFLLR